MPCYHPLKAFPVGLTAAGKTQYKIVPYGVHHLEQRNGTLVPIDSDFVSPYAERVILDFVTVPCGHCVGCRLDYSRQWANRCMLELEYHDSAFFITLTYDDDHVPRSWYADPETGEAFESLTLRKKDFQDFMKRLRYYFPDDHIRFFAAGEYGSNTFRPHYHAIVFGLHLTDLQLFRQSPDGFNYYSSPTLCKVWPFGFVAIANVSWDTCAYTARYVMKKLTGPEAEFYEDHNIEPPFTLMSRKPGIAKQWYDDHPDLYDYEYINISTPTGGKKFRPPKYFDKLFDVDCPEKSAELKAIRRRMAEEAQKAKMQRTDLSFIEYLAVEEEAKLNSVKKLERSKV